MDMVKFISRMVKIKQIWELSRHLVEIGRVI